MLLDSLRPTLFLTMVQPLKYHETGHLEILQGLGENKTKNLSESQRKFKNPFYSLGETYFYNEINFIHVILF